MVRVTMSNVTDSEKPKHSTPQMHHQDQFEPVERPPFQMMLPLQHQFVGDGHLSSPSSRSNSVMRPGTCLGHDHGALSYRRPQV